MSLDKNLVHFHVIAISMSDPKLGASKPKQLRPSKNRERQKKNKAKRAVEIQAWKKTCKARGIISEKRAYTKALKELQDRYCLDLSRFSAAPSARLSHLSFEGDRTFPAQR